MNNTSAKSERTNKATHTGTCQACGRSQKLPGGLLAKHGYTVEWGFFNGTCPGSHHQPFELSCDLIKGFIDNAKSQREYVISQQAKFRTPIAGATKAFVQMYDPKRRYYWDEVTIEEKHHSYPDDTAPDGVYRLTTYENTAASQAYAKRKRIHFYSNAPTDLADACHKLNCIYAASMDKQIANLDRYIAWQTQRVANWTLQPIAPIK